MENETTPDEIAFVSIIRVVFGNISRTTPTIQEVTIRTDIATTYNISLMYVLVQWIARKYGIRIRNILHTEVQAVNVLWVLHSMYACGIATDV